MTTTMLVRSSAPPFGAETSGLGYLGIAVLGAIAICLPVLGLGGWMVRDGVLQKRAAAEAVAWQAAAHDRLVAAAPGPVIDAAIALHGREVFMATCFACHGPEGRGISGLGKDLTGSAFVALQDDRALAGFIATGRPNAEPVPMPPKGGRADLTAEDLRDVALYLRGLQDPRRMPVLAAYVPPKPAEATEDEKAQAMAAAGGDAELAGYIASGKRIFGSTCIACHGAGGAGIQGNGKKLADNAFVQSLDDEALLKFVQGGRAPSDPRNTTGIQMPPKGGNPALSEDDLLDVISYLRTLQPKKTASSGR
ncbi:MAG: c-type cytochrome [Phycisphaerales bacterium]